jgi:hypothetical protein
VANGDGTVQDLPHRAAPAPLTLAAVLAAAVPRLDWRSCGEAAPGFECATAQVPLDHDRPAGQDHPP